MYFIMMLTYLGYLQLFLTLCSLPSQPWTPEQLRLVPHLPQPFPINGTTAGCSTSLRPCCSEYTPPTKCLGGHYSPVNIVPLGQNSLVNIVPLGGYCPPRTIFTSEKCPPLTIHIQSTNNLVIVLKSLYSVVQGRGQNSPVKSVPPYKLSAGN